MGLLRTHVAYNAHLGVIYITKCTELALSCSLNLSSESLPHTFLKYAFEQEKSFGRVYFERIRV